MEGKPWRGKALGGNLTVVAHNIFNLQNMSNINNDVILYTMLTTEYERQLVGKSTQSVLSDPNERLRADPNYDAPQQTQWKVKKVLHNLYNLAAAQEQRNGFTRTSYFCSNVDRDMTNLDDQNQKLKELGNPSFRTGACFRTRRKHSC